MIAYLKGILIQKSPNQIVVDTGGVGYCLGIPLSTYLKLGECGEAVEIFVYTHLTDNALNLYGFSNEDEREIFLKLIGISGIGPKIALNVLSGIEVSDLKESIKRGDVTRMTLIPGIGKKIASRIVLELQEKLEEKEKLLKAKTTRERDDLISALMNLGFKRKEIVPVVEETLRELSQEAGFEDLLRESLRRLAKV